MICIVDDDISVRRSFASLFKAANMKYSAFGSAEEFLNNFQPDKENVLILDMQMPGMNGCELLDILSSQSIKLPVIVVTAFDDPETRECAKKYGVIAVMRKPVDGEALIDLIGYNLNEN